MLRFLLKIFKIRREQTGRVALVFLYAFLSAASYVMTRSAADSIYLSRIDYHELPKAYMIAAVAVGLVTIVYSRFARHRSLTGILVVTQLLFACLSCLFPWALIDLHHSLPLITALYVFAEIRGAFTSIQFATLANEVFNEDDPRSVFGFISSGATCAGILTGAAIGYLATSIQTVNFLYVAAVVDLLVLIPILKISKHLPDKRSTTDGSLSISDIETAGALEQIEPSSTLFRSILKDRYARCIAVMILLQVIILTFIKFEWSVASARVFDDDEDRMTRFFGIYYSNIYIITGFIQLFLTSRILKRYTLLTGLLLFPGSLFLTVLGGLAATTERGLLIATTLAKSCEAIRRSIGDPSIKILYWPLPIDLRRQTIAMVTGVIKPFSEAFAGFLIFYLFYAMEAHQMFPILLGIIILWGLSAIGCYKMYRQKEKQPDSPSAPRRGA